MSLDTLLTIALDGAFFAAFGFTLVDYLRHRERVRLAVVLVFASLAAVLGVPLLRLVFPAIGPAAGVLVIPALLAHPVLVLWLASFVQPIPRIALIGASAAFLALTVAFVALLAGGVTSGSPAVTALGVALVAYFFLIEGGAAIGFALAARKRAGASRSRLSTAAIATGLLALALVVLLGGGLVFQPGSDIQAALNVLARVVALLSALGYLAAFTPPPALRRLSQQSIAYDFIRDLNALPSGVPVERIWELLERTAGARVGRDTGEGGRRPA